MIKFCLAGNPNCGKTTLFNSLTGSTAHVGNWPGVTVDKKEGLYKKLDEQIDIIDLPGIYSLSPYTPEEVIARNFIIEEKPDCVINVVDATNIERNLYLTTQILEIDVPVIVALNFIDSVEKNGDKIFEKELEKRLGVPVVKISALKNIGLDELMERAYQTSKIKRLGKTIIADEEIKHLISDVKIALDSHGVDNSLYHAIKLVENDELEIKMHPNTIKMVENFKKVFKDDIFGTEYDALIADARYKYITKNLVKVVVYKNPDRFNANSSTKADRILTHKIWGIPIFVAILFAIFHITFSENFLFLSSIFNMPTLESLNLVTDGEYVNFGAKLLSCIYDGTVYSPGVSLNNLWNNVFLNGIFGSLQNAVENSTLKRWAIGLINNGIIDGVCSVLSFLPWILVLFLQFSILEDSGYMARIAFILDKIFRKFGLSGRAFLPMIMGFGCSVPAIINTRTLADDKEKIATIRVIPFFSCGAKLPILTAITGAIVSHFQVGNADLITFLMYLLGVVTAFVTIVLMRSTSLKGEIPPFIMELPTYRLPQFKSTMLHLWDKAKHFISKAFTVILASTIVVWVLSHFNFSCQYLEDEQINESILANFGRLFQPLFTPLGFGSQLGQFGWVFVVGIVTGLIAKENVIASFSTIGACLIGLGSFNFNGIDILAEDGIGAVSAMIIATNVTIPALLAYIAFNMTTIPCFASVATAKAELNDKKIFRNTLVFWLLVSYVVSTMVYTIGSWWWTAFIWLALIILTILSIIFYNKKVIVVRE